MRKYWRYLPGVFFLIVAGLLMAQSEKTSALVKERVQEKMRKYKINHEKNCLRRVLEEASRRADSLMMEYARAKLDTAGIPHLPERPAPPAILQPKDTTALQPLFRE